MMDIHQILKQLPHRYPILLVDRVKAGIHKFNARARVDGELACEAQLMCTMRKIA